jgi:hypothetical protein
MRQDVSLGAYREAECVVRKSAMVAVVSLTMIFQPSLAHAQRAPDVVPQHAPAQSPKTSDDEHARLTDVAIAALIIAASVAIYKSTGKPCACPNDTARNGSSCGGRSAWSKPGGAKPVCFPADINADMIKAYRTTKAIPAVW